MWMLSCLQAVQACVPAAGLDSLFASQQFERRSEMLKNLDCFASKNQANRSDLEVACNRVGNRRIWILTLDTKIF